MAQSLSKVFIHIVFSTKNRKPIILEKVEKQLFNVIGGKIRSIGGISIQINGTSDHIHILAVLPRTMSISDFIKRIKTGSSQWIKTQGHQYQNFSWQNGYGVFSVGHSDLEKVKQYIADQKKHHINRQFKDELLQLLIENDIEYDDKYIWV